jgi:hypothetical protein
VTWYADPSGASEGCELRRDGFCVRNGLNAIRSGIAGVSARIQCGMLKIIEGKCPNLLAEADLYRYSDDPHDRRSETPIDDHNHALAALRYLVSRVDGGRMVRPKITDPQPQPPAGDTPPLPQKKKRPWLSLYNPALWGEPFIIERPFGPYR